MSRPSTAVEQWPIPGRPGGLVRLHLPGQGKTSWRVTFPNGRGGTSENTRRTREAAAAHALAMVDQLTAVVGGPSLGRERISALVDYYMTAFAQHKRWKPGYRDERARTARWLPQWFLDLRVSEWHTRHCDQVLAEVAARGHTRGSGEYWRVGTLLSGLVTAAERGDFLRLTQDRRSPMLSVEYDKDPNYGAGPGCRPSGGGSPSDFGYVRPVLAEEIPGHCDVRDYAEVAGRRCGFRWMVHGRLLAESGIREAESLRLTAADLTLDPSKPFVHVWRQLVEVRKDLNDGLSLLTEEPPKNGEDRRAWFPPDLIPLLEQLVEEVAALPGSTPPADRPLFYGRRGGLVRPNNWRRNVFAPTARELGWEKIAKGIPDPKTGERKMFWVWPPHSLRHHAATWMLKDLGLNPVTVAMYLGHKNSAFTERMYLDRTSLDFTASNEALRRWTETQLANGSGTGTGTVAGA